jgi:PAS domain S-box-containing protein
MHRRVPLGCYKIGRVAAAEEPGFITNEASVDPRVHDHAWARELGLVSFAGCKLQRETGEPIGVLALFSKHEIQRDERALFETIAGIASQVILTAITKEDVERKERYYRSLLHSMHEDIVVIDRDYTVSDVNRTCLVTTGAKRSEVIGRHCYEVVYGESEPCTCDGKQCVLPAVFETGEPHSCRHTFHRGDGSVGHVDILLSPQRDETGAVIQVIEAIRDVTQLVEAQEAQRHSEAELRQWQKLEAIGQLAGGVAHAFNNIMTAIMGHAEMSIYDLRAELGPEHTVVRSVEEIDMAARQASELTQQLLAFSRRSMIRPEVLSLNRILQDLDGMLRRLITENITLTITTHPQLLTVRADVRQIERVVVNLVGNAVHAMPNGGRLSLETQNVFLGDDQIPEVGGAQPGPHVLLSVSDTGGGMDEATRERIFEPFFTTKEMDRGTGLGLATVLGIVQQAGGHIQVYSELGCGTTFKIYIPALEESRDEMDDLEADASELGGSETLLLCEDDRAVRILTARLLESAGYTVLVAASGREALDLAANDCAAFDLLVTDVIMTDINGRQLSDALTERRPDLRTLYISGYTSDVIAHHGVLDDGVELLQKPFSRRRLLARVREVLELGRGAPEPRDGKGRRNRPTR